MCFERREKAVVFFIENVRFAKGDEKDGRFGGHFVGMKDISELMLMEGFGRSLGDKERPDVLYVWAPTLMT